MACQAIKLEVNLNHHPKLLAIMPTTITRLRKERKRLETVRKAFTKAVSDGARGEEAYIHFYVAVSNYIQQAMHKLHEQDYTLLKLIEEKADLEHLNTSLVIDDVYDKLANSKLLLEEFVIKSEAIDPINIDTFEEIGQRYTDYIQQRMGHHPPTTELADKLLSETDWQTVANFNEQSIQTEEKLFDQVVKTAPDNIQRFLFR